MQAQPICVEPGTKIRLADFDPGYDEGLKKDEGQKQAEKYCQAIGDWTYRLYAENRRSLLVVLQGMDTAGKDGAIRHVLGGIDPQSCHVYPFKRPSDEELEHDFLWRVHRQVPRRGDVGIFNRSHYEDVVIVRVHQLVPESEWRKRYDHINAFERLLTDTGTRVVKIFLHISKEEQRERLMARLENPNKRWKFSKQDVDERKRWDEYQEAYEEALSRCNTAHAPWYIVPSDRKWYRNLVIGRLLHDVLSEMNPQFPPAEEGLDEIVVE